MGKTDIITKDYVRDGHIFADVFNKLIYEGRNVIDPKALRSVDATVIGMPYGTEDAGVPVQKFRDALKCLGAMEDDSAIYLLLGVEVQSETHYAMPVRNMLYDALQYVAQVDEAAKSYHEKNGAKVKKRSTPAEYLSGFYRDDKLLPVITVTLHLGVDEWDGPMTLHEMLALNRSELLEFLPDYRMNLISPMSLTDEEINQFHTSLREVMLFIKYSKDKKKLGELLCSDERFQAMERDVVRVIKAVTRVELELKEEQEVVDVCQAWKEMGEDMRREGRKEGQRKSQMDFAEKLLRKAMFSLEEISELTELPLEEVKELALKCGN